MNESALGLYFFNARWYDAALGRFTSADTLVPEPGEPQAWDRYAFVINRPTRFIDPTGHWYYDPGCDCLVITKTSGNEHLESLTYVNTANSQLGGNKDYRNQKPGKKYSFPDQPDYRSLSIYFGQFGSLIELLLAQLEPTPFTELLSPAAGQLFSGGATITIDKYGRIYISPGAALGRTLVTYPLLGMPSVSYTYGYIERGESHGLEGKATREELDNLLRGGGRSHGFCGPIFPCVNRTYSLTSQVNVWEWGFGTPQINFITIIFGLRP